LPPSANIRLKIPSQQGVTTDTQTPQCGNGPFTTRP